MTNRKIFVNRAQNYMSDLHQVFVYVNYCRESVPFWRRCDMLCRPTSGVVGDVMFAHNG